VITSPDNPRVKEVLRLRKSRERRRAGLFIAEGPREVGRARAAGLRIVTTYVAPELIAWDPAREGAGGSTEEVSARVLAKMAYRSEPEGVLAVVEIPQRTLAPDPTLVLIAVGIEKPGNLGAMARTADAAGADALLLGDATVDPWNPNAIRASTGAVFALPIIEMTRDEVASLPIRKVAAVLGSRALHTEPDYTRRRGRRPRRRVVRTRRRERGDPDEGGGGGLAERECRRRCVALRSRPSAVGYLRFFCFAIAPASRSPVMNMWLYAAFASVYDCL
jgi:TrmH family RNA methyltransferase